MSEILRRALYCSQILQGLSMGMHDLKYLSKYGGQKAHDHGQGVHVSKYTAI